MGSILVAHNHQTIFLRIVTQSEMIPVTIPSIVDVVEVFKFLYDLLN